MNLFQQEDGTPGSSSAAFRACLDISENSEDISDGNNSYSGETTIVPPSSSSDPTTYQTITYSKVNYSNPNGTFSNSSGEITLNQNMKAQITYVTTIRGKNNDDYCCFVKLEKYNGSSWSEIDNSSVSATIKSTKPLNKLVWGI